MKIRLGHRDLSVAAGVSVQYFNIRAKQKISPRLAAIEGLMNQLSVDRETATTYYETLLADSVDPLGDMDQDAELDDWGLRCNIGIRYAVTDALSLGLHYRSMLDYELEGDADYDDVTALFQGDIYNADVAADISLPDILAVGAAYAVSDQLTVSADLVWTGWSRFESIDYDFDNGLGQRSQAKDYDDTLTYRLGCEYHLTPAWDLRMGYLYDESPVPEKTMEYALPCNDRHMMTVGGGYRQGAWSVDTHFTYIVQMDKDIPEWEAWGLLDDAEVVDGVTYQIGFNFGYRF